VTRAPLSSNEVIVDFDGGASAGIGAALASSLRYPARDLMKRHLTTFAALAVAAFAWIGIAVLAALGRGEVKPSLDAGGWLRVIGQSTKALEEALAGVVAGLPELSRQVAASTSAALATTPEGRDAVSQMLLVAAVIMTFGLLSLVIRGTFRTAITAATVEGDTPVFLLVLRDAVDVAALTILSFLAMRLLFPGEAPLDKLAAGIVWAVVRWRITLALLDVLLRPGWPQARLITAADSAVRVAFATLALALALGIVFISVAPVLLGGGLSAPAARALALIVGIVEGALVLLALRSLFSGTPQPPRWFRIAAPAAVVLLMFIWTVAVLRLEFSVYHAALQCLQALLGAYTLDRLLVVGSGGIDVVYATAIRRVIWLVTAASVMFGLANLVLVSGLHVITPAAWATIQRGYASAFLILVSGFALAEGLKAWARVRFGTTEVIVEPGEEIQPEAQTRFATVMPIALGFLGSTILVVTLMFALSELGISIGPLIAGAGIIGLAFSFGSQALVRDIVSGMFYMMDDAFRVGEYIDTGRHKGTVERISLRSLKLRHQNGHFHNVPYGQFGAVTNYSRDFVTMKFNLRLARNIDIEQVRKVTKELGRELLNDEEFGPEFLLPLKLQGVADVQETAIVLRFKFTAKPIQPTVVRREVMKRLFLRFRELGIQFARNSVRVEGDDEGASVRVPGVDGAAAHVVTSQRAPIAATGS